MDGFLWNFMKTLMEICPEIQIWLKSGILQEDLRRFIVVGGDIKQPYERALFAWMVRTYQAVRPAKEVQTPCERATMLRYMYFA